MNADEHRSGAVTFPIWVYPRSFAYGESDGEPVILV